MIRTRTRFRLFIGVSAVITCSLMSLPSLSSSANFGASSKAVTERGGLMANTPEQARQGEDCVSVRVSRATLQSGLVETSWNSHWLNVQTGEIQGGLAVGGPSR